MADQPVIMFNIVYFTVSMSKHFLGNPHNFAKPKGNNQKIRAALFPSNLPSEQIRSLGYEEWSSFKTLGLLANQNLVVKLTEYIKISKIKNF